MNDKLWVDYLVIGGKRHGERYVAQEEESEVFVKAKINPLIEFIGLHITSKANKDAGAYHKVEKFEYNGKKFLLAILESKADYDIEKLILRSNPPVKPIN